MQWYSYNSSSQFATPFLHLITSRISTRYLSAFPYHIHVFYAPSHPPPLSTVAVTSSRISARFCFTDIMNRGKDTVTNSSSGGNSAILFNHVSDTSSSSKDCYSNAERNEQEKYFEIMEHKMLDDYNCRPTFDLKMRKKHSSNIGWGKHGHLDRRRRWLDLGPEVRTSDIKDMSYETLSTKKVTSEEEITLPTQFGKNCIPPCSKKSKSGKSFIESTAAEGLRKAKPFDICLPQIRNTGRVQSSFGGSYEEEQNIVGCTILESGRLVLQPGMVLLKHYITHNYQVKIVNTCRELDLRPGGFYRPGYKGGGKLHLHMMCLGLNWDPNTRKYEEERSVDSCKPPGIPYQLYKLVKRAIRDAHTFVRLDSEVRNAEDMLPTMSPDICIVNFYTETGRLGLHQDRDESAESLAKGLPVVSLSVGDSAEFLYGDERDVNKAKKLVLESGDVLIFGGRSRHIYHGISSIIPNTAPQSLVEETGIRTGRLNLTFRQF